MKLLGKSGAKPGQGKHVGRPYLPAEPDLTWLDEQILQLAILYRRQTGKPAARGAMGRRFTNQGGPFVTFAAQKLGLVGSEDAIVARIKRFERHPRLKSLWHVYRTPARITFATFLKSQEV